MLELNDWLNQNGFIIKENGFVIGDSTVADMSFFERAFWPALKNALDNGTSTYDAVMEVDAGTKGWKQYFDAWKEKGILI